MREGDWKLVSAYDYAARKFKDWELYNLKNDRSELNDLSGEYPERKSEMMEKYEEWCGRAGVVSRELMDRK